MDPSLLEVHITTDSQEAARVLARELVERRLAACVQIVKIESCYRWQGAVESADEWLLLGKTTESAYAALESTVRELHSYDQPEILAIPVARCDSGYAAWVVEQTTTSESSGSRGEADRG